MSNDDDVIYRGYNRKRVLGDERACGVRAPQHVYYYKKGSTRVVVDAVYGKAAAKYFRDKNARGTIMILDFVPTLPVDGLKPYTEE